MKVWLIILFSLSLSACQTLDSLKNTLSGTSSSSQETEESDNSIDTSEVNYRLGLRYTNGIGGKKDFEAAAKAFKKAAEQNHPKAQLMLGLAYQSGLGVNADQNRAIRWLTRSANQHIAEAQFELGKKFLEGKGLDVEEAWGAHWLGRAATQGHTEAQFLLGVSWSTGLGLPKRFYEGAFWVSQAAKKQHEQAVTLQPKLMSQLTEQQKQKLAQHLSWWKPSTKQSTTPKSLVYFVQYALSKQGINPGSIDGLTGPKTKAAVAKYQTTVMGITGDGTFSQEVITSLRDKLRGKTTEF